MSNKMKVIIFFLASLFLIVIAYNRIFYRGNTIEYANNADDYTVYEKELYFKDINGNGIKVYVGEKARGKITYKAIENLIKNVNGPTEIKVDEAGDESGYNIFEIFK